MHQRRFRKFLNKRCSYATPNHTAATVLSLLGGLFVEYGAPVRLLYDRDLNQVKGRVGRTGFGSTSRRGQRVAGLLQGLRAL